MYPHFKSVIKDTGKAFPLTAKLEGLLRLLAYLGFLILENFERDLEP
jgi:hypothetical protein